MENNIDFKTHSFNYKDINKISASASSAIENLNKGIFDEAVKLALDMCTDGRLQSAFTSRISGVFNERLRIVNSSFPDDDKAILDSIDDNSLKQFWFNYLMLGVGVLRVNWILSENGKYLPSVRNFLPVGLRYDSFSEQYYIVVTQASEEEIKTRTDIIDASTSTSISALENSNIQVEIINNNPKWIILSNGTQGHLYGLIHSLVDDWISCTSAREDLNKFNSDQNGRIWKAKVPSENDNGSNLLFAKSLANIKRYGVITLPQFEDQYNSFDVEGIDPTTSTVYTSYMETIKSCQTNYAVTILGQNLTTEVNGGSFAATESHMQVRSEIINSDKETFFKCLNNELIGYYRAINNEKYDGEFLYQLDNSQEVINTLETLNTLTQTILNLREVGKTINIEKVIEDLNISYLEDYNESSNINESI